MKEFSCGDVVPGCGQHFRADSDEAILAQVAAHAAEAHGITQPTADLVAEVTSKIRVAA